MLPYEASGAVDITGVEEKLVDRAGPVDKLRHLKDDDVVLLCL